MFVFACFEVTKSSFSTVGLASAVLRSMPSSPGGERRKKRDEMATFASEVRLDAARFAEAGVDAGDVTLDYEEFYAMHPAHIRSAHAEEEIKKWFDLASGGKPWLTVTDFFRFSLTKASEAAGPSALRDCFKRWDKDRSGYLDAMEFAQAMHEMGYGAMSHTLFKSLDVDNSGAVSYDELAAALLHSAAKMPGASLSTLMWVGGAGDEGGRAAGPAAPAIDTSKWQLKGTDAQSLREELKAHMASSGARVADLIKAWAS